MIVLDANVLIALFDPADASHTKAEAVLLAHADEHLAMPALTFAEFLIRPTATGVAARAELFVANMGIIVSPLLADDSRHLAGIRTASGLKMPDAVVLWLALGASAKLLTFDDHLATAARAVGVEVVPIDE